MRKPIHDQAMTGAERARRHRARKAAEKAAPLAEEGTCFLEACQKAGIAIPAYIENAVKKFITMAAV